MVPYTLDRSLIAHCTLHQGSRMTNMWTMKSVGNANCQMTNWVDTSWMDHLVTHFNWCFTTSYWRIQSVWRFIVIHTLRQVGFWLISHQVERLEVQPAIRQLNGWLYHASTGTFQLYDHCSWIDLLLSVVNTWRNLVPKLPCLNVFQQNVWNLQEDLATDSIYYKSTLYSVAISFAGSR
jgi:hypothetical protein